MRPGDLAPDYPDLGALDLSLCPVDEGDLLAQVEAICRTRLSHPSFTRSTDDVVRYSLGGLRVIHTLNLDQTGVRIGVALSALVAQVAAPVNDFVLIVCSNIPCTVPFQCPNIKHRGSTSIYGNVGKTEAPYLTYTVGKKCQRSMSAKLAQIRNPRPPISSPETRPPLPSNIMGFTHICGRVPKAW